MRADHRTKEELLAEIEDLRLRLEEAADTLSAIQSGEVDALVVRTLQGDRIFSLEGAEHPYRILVESMNQGAATLTADGTVLYCNARLAAMLKVPLENLIGLPLASYVAPADRRIWSASLGKCLLEARTDEIAMLDGSGSVIPVLVSCCGLDLSDTRGISLVVTDLTQQKRNEETLASERLARSIIEQAGEAIIVCDQGGRIIRASRLAHQLCGKDLLLKPFDQLFELRMAQAPDPFSVATLLKGVGSFENVEVEFIRHDNRKFHLLLNATPLHAVQDIIGCVVTLTDLTEQKRAEDALQKAHEELEQRVTERTAELTNALKEIQEKEYMLLQQSRLAAMGEMIGNIAHQWRQPLNSLGLNIQRMPLYHEAGIFTPEFLDEAVTDAMEQIQHMSNTIDDFRNFFEPDKEKVEFHLGEVVTKSIKLIQSSFDSRRIEIEVNYHDDPVIYGYPNEYSQVILNILSNAKDAIEARKIEEPRVVIGVCATDGKSVLSIRDNAGGIPDRIISKIFEPHFTTKGSHGTGIGLFMAKNIIERNMHGRLSVCNTSDGAEFRIEV